ncbi:hypothetical protein BKA18_000216 [Streptomyces auratus]
MKKQRGTGRAAPRASEVHVHATTAEIAVRLRYVCRRHTGRKHHTEEPLNPARLAHLSGLSPRNLTSAARAEAPTSPSGP